MRAFASALAVAFVALLVGGSAQALIISEVMANPVGGFGSDDGLEWIELYNDDTVSVDLSGYSLGWGGADYTYGSLSLAGAGTLSPGEFIIIGGPDPGAGINWFSDPLDPDLPDGFFTAAGVALFAGTDTSVTPLDAVVYTTFFGFNINGLVDETGGVAGIDANTGGAGESIERVSPTGWAANATPTPGSNTLIPEPGTAMLLGAGLLLMGRQRRR